MFLLSQVVERHPEEGSQFSLHPRTESCKLLWRDGQAVGFYTVKHKGETEGRGERSALPFPGDALCSFQPPLRLSPAGFFSSQSCFVISINVPRCVQRVAVEKVPVPPGQINYQTILSALFTSTVKHRHLCCAQQ